MLASRAREVAYDFVQQVWADEAGYAGAFFAGSITELPAEAQLPSSSDVDVSVVWERDERPRTKPGKRRVDDLLLEITILTASDLSDPDRVAGTYYLAPSFRGGQLIDDPTGHLGRLERYIAQSYAHPDAVMRRVDHVLDLILQRLEALDGSASWHRQVSAWMFPTSLTTQIPLVAALQTPTVRRRYLAARKVLDEAEQPLIYQQLLTHLGCADVDSETVQAHLDALTSTYDLATTLARTPFFFSTDVSHDARPVAIEGSQQLINEGNHREAVFWIVATFARCLSVLAADAPSVLAEGHASAFRSCTRDLLGLEDESDLIERRLDCMNSLPMLRDTAAQIARGRSGTR